MISRFLALLLIALLLNLNASSLLAEGWGNVEGQIVLEGEIPKISLLVDDGEVKVPDESRMFDSDTKGIANVAIYLRAAPEIHPDLKDSYEKFVEFKIRNRKYGPHALVVRTDQKVRVSNGDQETYSIRINTFRNTLPCFLPPPKGDSIEFQLPFAETIPVRIACDFHPWMRAWWVVVDHPYAAMTDRNGNFHIRKLPAGEHSFRVWHERTGYINRKLTVTVEADRTTKLEPISVPVEKFVD